MYEGKFKQIVNGHLNWWKTAKLLVQIVEIMRDSPKHRECRRTDDYIPCAQLAAIEIIYRGEYVVSTLSYVGQVHH